jgi:hypothetical protein
MSKHLQEKKGDAQWQENSIIPIKGNFIFPQILAVLSLLPERFLRHVSYLDNYYWLKEKFIYL